MSESITPGANGITAHAAYAGANAKIGAMKNRYQFDFVGMIISFKKSFKASIIGCNKPKEPTLFGPSLSCI
jgi:hypothetical protein